MAIAARLIVLAQAGDRRAFDDLFQQLQQPLFRYVRTLVTGPSLAEDVLQEVFLLIYRKIVHLNDPALFLPWCYRIASRESMRRLRDESRRRETELPDVLVDPRDLQNHEVDLQPFIERAPPASRAVLALHFLEGFSLEETAAILDVPLGTAKSRLSYGLKSLREEVKRENG